MKFVIAKETTAEVTLEQAKDGVVLKVGDKNVLRISNKGFIARFYIHSKDDQERLGVKCDHEGKVMTYEEYSLTCS
jgi:hypothetical protein